MKLLEPLPLRWQVAFDPAIEVEDELGGVAVTWGDQASPPTSYLCRAHFTYLRTGEAVQQARLLGRRVIAVRIRANATALTIDQSWRMRDLATGEVFNVRGVEPVPDSRQYLEVLVEGGEVT